MDTLSHGLWGGLLFGKRNKKSFWTSFAFGVLPDILVFGPSFAMAFFALITGGESGRFGPPEERAVPPHLYFGYSITHSLVVFTAAFLAVWLIRKKPLYEMFAWPAHIILDLPTHSARFFPTPYLWPFAHPKLDGTPWSHPAIFFPNVALLVILYGWFFFGRKRYRAWRACRIGGMGDAPIDKTH